MTRIAGTKTTSRELDVDVKVAELVTFSASAEHTRIIAAAILDRAIALEAAARHTNGRGHARHREQIHEAKRLRQLHKQLARICREQGATNNVR